MITPRSLAGFRGSATPDRRAAVEQARGRMARLRTQARPPFPGLRATRWNHPNESVRNRVLYRKLEEAMEYVGERYARGCLLDIGCGQKPWESLFARYVDEHV